jgi:predicted glycosyltransferase
MCGYNTAGEIMGHRPKTVLVPRTWKYGEHHQRDNAKQEMEQLLRAKALARFNFVRMIEPRDLNPENLSEKINELLAMGRKKQTNRINIDGVHAAAYEIISIAAS